jgi:hypothetical protein
MFVIIRGIGPVACVIHTNGKWCMCPRNLGRKRPLCRRRLTREVNTEWILNKYEVKDTDWTEPGSGWIPKASPGGHGRVF